MRSNLVFIIISVLLTILVFMSPMLIYRWQSEKNFIEAPDLNGMTFKEVYEKFGNNRVDQNIDMEHYTGDYCITLGFHYYSSDHRYIRVVFVDGCAVSASVETVPGG